MANSPTSTSRSADCWTYWRNLELNDRTLIILAGDHGEGLGEHGEATHGYLAYNSTLHVPLLILLPAPAHPHVPVSQPVSLVDISPTILSALDLPIPQGVSGRNLLPHNSAASTNARACYGESEALTWKGAGARCGHGPRKNGN
ncbi:MAG: sulfatase-like hydrolase/transferase [Planctomycetaceae bacterium]